MDEVINTPLLWVICSITVVVVVAQGVIYYRLAYKNALDMGAKKSVTQRLKLELLLLLGLHSLS